MMSANGDATANSTSKCDHCGVELGVGRWCQSCNKAACVSCALQHHRDLQHQLQSYADANTSAQQQRQQTATQLKKDIGEIECATEKSALELKEAVDRVQSLSAGAMKQLTKTKKMLANYETLTDQPLSEKTYDKEGRLSGEIEQHLVALTQVSTDLNELITKWSAAMPMK